jgi:hypothetical protein
MVSVAVGAVSVGYTGSLRISGLSPPVSEDRSRMRVCTWAGGMAPIPDDTNFSSCWIFDWALPRAAGTPGICWRAV